MVYPGTYMTTPITLRFYPDPAFLAQYSCVDAGCFEDVFRRETTGAAWRRRRSRVSSDAAAAADQDRSSSTSIRYTFRRTEYLLGVDGVELYVDELTAPAEYVLATVRISDATTATAATSAAAVVAAMQERAARRPLFSKFMLVMQCSVVYEGDYGDDDEVATKMVVEKEEEDVILTQEVVLVSSEDKTQMRRAVDRVLEDKASLMANRDYVWFASAMIGEAQMIRDISDCANDADIWERVNRVRPTGNVCFCARDPDDWPF